MAGYAVAVTAFFTGLNVIEIFIKPILYLPMLKIAETPGNSEDDTYILISILDFAQLIYIYIHKN